MSRQNKRRLIAVSNRGVRVLGAFVLGQVVQLILHGVCFDFWEQYQIPFCIAGGFLMTLAVFAGIRIAVKEGKEEMAREFHWENLQ